MAHQAGAYSSFCSLKHLQILFSTNGMLVHLRVNRSIKFAANHLYAKVERGTVRVKCLHSLFFCVCFLPGQDPGSFDPEVNVTIMRPTRQHSNNYFLLSDVFTSPVWLTLNWFCKKKFNVNLYIVHTISSIQTVLRVRVMVRTCCNQNNKQVLDVLKPGQRTLSKQYSGTHSYM